MTRQLVLRDGATMESHLLSPPLKTDLAERLSAFVNRFLKEEFLKDVLLGRADGEGQFAFAFGHVAEQLVGTCWAGWGRRLPSLAVMGGVATDEKFRGLGVASDLVARMVEECPAGAAGRIFLGTTNAVAERIYSRLGFCRAAGQVFCRDRSGTTLCDAFAPGQRLVTRQACWGHLAAIVPLFLLEHPCILLDAHIPIPSARLVPPWRCVRIFWEIWASVQNGGHWRLLETDRGWVVGTAVARPRTTQSGGRANFSVDFLWHPNYPNQGADFLAAFVSELEASGQASCELLVAEGDTWKLDAARGIGYDRAARTGKTVEVAGRVVQLCALTRGRRTS